MVFSCCGNNIHMRKWSATTKPETIVFDRYSIENSQQWTMSTVTFNRYQTSWWFHCIINIFTAGVVSKSICRPGFVDFRLQGIVRIYITKRCCFILFLNTCSGCQTRRSQEFAMAIFGRFLVHEIGRLVARTIFLRSIFE